MARTRKPKSEMSLLADYLLSQAERDAIGNVIHAEIQRQQRTGQLAIIRGSVSAMSIAGALAEAGCEQELQDSPYEPFGG